METKICSRCQKEKPVTDFHRKGDGYLSICKVCKAEYMTQRRAEKGDELRAKNRAYYQENCEAVKNRGAAWRENSHERKREMNRNHYEKNRQYYLDYMANYSPERKAAHKALSAAKAAKLIKVPKTCSVCGSAENIEGHHFDYNEPLVVWLCKKCHKGLHGFVDHGTAAFRAIHDAAKSIWDRSFTNKRTSRN